MSESKTPPDGDVARAITELATQVENLEDLADHMATLAAAVGALSDNTAASIIAQHGTDEDRKRVVEQLKSWFFQD